jgi:hypothetical protein
MKRLIARGAFVSLLGLAAGPAVFAEDGHCRSVDGPFSSVLVEPPECTSPVGLCTHGDLEGDLEANYDFTAATLAPANDPAHPGRLHYTGTSVITLKHGNTVMYSDDTGDLDPDATGNAMFITTAHVIRGTRSAKNTVGTLIASGTLSFATGQATGGYTGELCKDNDR